MMDQVRRYLIVFALFFASANTQASVLYDYAFNVDGTVTAGTPGSVDPTVLGLDASGLGTMTFTFSSAGSHNFVSFFDFEIDEPNNTFFNEYGSTGGTLAAGQSWEIDEPGYVFGDIYDNMLAGSLDNTNAVSAGDEDDVSFAMGWSFLLEADETATLTLTLSDILDTTGFYLQHTDDEVGPNFDQSESVYFWSTLSIASTSVPEPSAFALMGIGLLGVGLARRRKS